MLAEQQTCAWCLQLATDDDHIIPTAWDGNDLDRANHHGLCATHHKVKTQAEARIGRTHRNAPLNARLSAVLALMTPDVAKVLRGEYTTAWTVTGARQQG